MRKLYTLLSLVFLLAFTACEEDNKTEIFYTPVNVVANLPEGIDIVAWDVLHLSFTNKNTGLVTEASMEKVNTLELSIEQGVYTVIVKGHADVAQDGKEFNALFIGEKQDLSISGDLAMDVAIDLVQTPEASPLLFQEIYISGSRTPAEKGFWGDSFFLIKNNSDEVQDIRGLSIAESDSYTDATDDDWADLTNSFAVQAIFTVPYNAEKSSLEPGETLLIANFPVDFSREDGYGNPNSPVKDMSHADFQWYVDAFNLDIDVAEVPNLDLLYSYSASIWIPSTQGNRSYILFQVPENEYETYATDYQVSVTGSNGKESIAVGVPYAHILDAVELGKLDDHTISLLPVFLDKSYISFDGAYSGTAVRRKTDTNGMLIDTNDSANDFEGSVAPSATPGV